LFLLKHYRTPPVVEPRLFAKVATLRKINFKKESKLTRTTKDTTTKKMTALVKKDARQKYDSIKRSTSDKFVAKCMPMTCNQLGPDMLIYSTLQGSMVTQVMPDQLLGGICLYSHLKWKSMLK